VITKPTYFSIDELVCEHVYNKYGAKSWIFFDTELLIMLDTIRDRIGKPIFVNDWSIGGHLNKEGQIVRYNERGLRCNHCDIVKKKAEAGILYMSAHCLGKGADFEVQGLLAEEVRQWIVKHANWWPYHIRLEADVNWVHLDVYDQSENKVYIFNK